MVIVCILCLRNKNVRDRKNEIFSEGERRLIGLVENTRDGFYYFELKPKWRYRYANPPFEVTFGEEKGKLVYDHPEMAFERVHPDDTEMLMKKVRGEVDYNQSIIYRIAMGEEAMQEGRYTLFEEYTTPVYLNGELVAIQGILRDITEKRQLEEELKYRLTHDRLTGLYNRDYFEGLMDTFNESENIPIAIVIADLDELKYYNDHYGHKKGDHLIKVSSNLLNTYSTDSVIVSRIGGDEFAILLINTTMLMAQEMIQSIQTDISSYNKDSTDVRIQMSIDYAWNEQSIGKMDSLFIEADRKMYERKKRWKEGAIHNS
nr:diguanylate cyclase [Paenibacillus sp. Marseille-Q4541]